MNMNTDSFIVSIETKKMYIDIAKDNLILKNVIL